MLPGFLSFTTIGTSSYSNVDIFVFVVLFEYIYSIYIRTVRVFLLLFALHNWFKLVYGYFVIATSMVYSILPLDHPGRIQKYQN